MMPRRLPTREPPSPSGPRSPWNLLAGRASEGYLFLYLSAGSPTVSIRARCLLILVLVIPAATALQAQSFTEFCRTVRVVRLGQWAEYDVAGGRSNGSHLRFAIVGSEQRGDSTFYWYEVTTSRGADRFIGHMLVVSTISSSPVDTILITTQRQCAKPRLA